MIPSDAETTRDEVLVEALGEGLSYARAGEVARCSKATVQRRMREPDFRAAVAERRQAAAEEAAEALEGLATRAVERLAELLDSEQELAAYRAVALVLERASQRQVARATGDRLERLEALVADLLDGQRRGLRGVA